MSNAGGSKMALPQAGPQSLRASQSLSGRPHFPRRSKMNVSLDIAALLAALAWPAVLAFVLLKYRGPIERLLGSDTINVQIPWGGISLQFATVRPMSQDPFAEVFRHP